jgi:hypothetical protein
VSQRGNSLMMISVWLVAANLNRIEAKRSSLSLSIPRASARPQADFWNVCFIACYGGAIVVVSCGRLAE